ncbi:MAG: hypothetical protein M1840_008326 [Geoglossum simile]|nr:MAG: hypothetical protein M1840_008326 [Geoglossum simile]
MKQYTQIPNSPSTPASSAQPLPNLPPFSSRVLQEWSTALSNAEDHPYTKHDPVYLPTTLLSASTPLRFSTGTGLSLLQSWLPTLLAETREELIIATCFWSKNSESVAEIRNLLVGLSNRISEARPSNATTKPATPNLKVRILLSSLSPLQKILHPSRPKHLDPASVSLPPASKYPNLSVQIRSLFLKPFSVMHPKYIIMDRRRAWVMSWNMSCEEWFEGCVEVEGDVVAGLVDFWRDTWGADNKGEREGEESPVERDRPCDATPLPSHPTFSTTTFPSQNPLPVLLLPSPHHRNPRFRPFPLRAPTPPPTPLNIFLLTLLSASTSVIQIYTPNLTSPPVLSALLAALSRGINIHITTPRRMMYAEQLVTAGTTTELCLHSLSRRYNRLVKRHNKNKSKNTNPPDTEPQQHPPGTLQISRYPLSPSTSSPQKSHLKLTIVDAEIAVLGSGNLDRASWYTSQEIGLAFFGTEVVAEISEAVRIGMGAG